MRRDIASYLLRLVFHIGGYDPILPPDGAYRRFLRELNRFERTWSVKASASAPAVSTDEMTLSHFRFGLTREGCIRTRTSLIIGVAIFRPP
jgi:hypothetical protein